MRAGQVTGPEHVDVVEVAEPGSPPDGACLVRVNWIGVCGSDVRRGFRPQGDATYPLPVGFPGHECMGTVVHSRAPGFSEGDGVLLHPQGLMGLQELVILTPERLARVPTDGGATEPFRWLMAEPAATVLHALHRAPSLLGQRVAIVGQGTMGLVWTALARRLGAASLHVVDLDTTRLDHARKLGADTAMCVPADKTGDVEQYGPLESFDVVVEAAGEIDATNAAIRLARREATVILFGTPEQAVVPLDYRTLRDRELATLCTAPGQGHRIGEVMRQMVDLVAAGWVDLSGLVTHVFAFDDVNRAFAIANARADGCVRAVLDVRPS